MTIWEGVRTSGGDYIACKDNILQFDDCKNWIKVAKLIGSIVKFFLLHIRNIAGN